MTSVRSYAVLGVRIDKEKLYKRVRIRGCQECDDEGGISPKNEMCPDEESSKNFTYCPVCGHAPFCDELIPIEGFDPWDLTLHREELISSHEDFYYGVWSQDSWDGRDCANFTGLMDPAAAMEEIKNFLEPLGLWNPDEFGIWGILDAS